MTSTIITTTTGIGTMKGPISKSKVCGASFLQVFIELDVLHWTSGFSNLHFSSNLDDSPPAIHQTTNAMDGRFMVPPSFSNFLNGTLLELYDAYIRTYLIMITFYGTIWSARLSILLTIIRIGHGTSPRKALLYFLSAVFFLLFALLVGQIFWIAFTQLGSDVLADLTLLLSSLQLFLIIQDRTLRHRLIYIFSTCTLTTAASMVHAVLIVKTAGGGGRAGEGVLMAALVEDSISLIVSSLPVLTNVLFQLCSRPSPVSRVNVSMSAAQTMTQGTIPLSFKFVTPSATPGTVPCTPSGSAGNLLQAAEYELPQLPSLPWQNPAQGQGPGQAHLHPSLSLGSNSTANDNAPPYQEAYYHPYEPHSRSQRPQGLRDSHRGLASASTSLCKSTSTSPNTGSTGMYALRRLSAPPNLNLTVVNA
ncbi:hypothetical protein CVT26_014488 [Gymnopilus dilepis]|uniref:Uncharacterized protein n=1 Tax=Gymnopilus dilepis TaxID=231916 RepID=A0A409VVF6_9AGAR|nr:hypothetical protein CVT26_014488 [Gymnopilus dilepis]